MLIIIICIVLLGVLVIIGVGGTKGIEEDNGHLLVIPITVGVGVVVFSVLVYAVSLFVIHHTDYYYDSAKAELQAKHDVIVSALDKSDPYCILLSDSIAEYNAEVMRGRRAMDEIWFRDFDFDFYYELELIEP